MLTSSQIEQDRAAVAAAIIPRFAAAGARMIALSGGRSNGIWRVEEGPNCLIAKLYRPGRASELFPNDAGAEHIALEALQGSGFAPRLIGQVETARGPCVIYQHVEGASLAPSVDGFTRAGAALAGLHRIAPVAGLREIPMGGAAIQAMALRFLEGLTGALAQELRARIKGIDVPDLGDIAQAFLHGDAVPGNIIDGPQGIVLIDWQCPARGDPCEDLAAFLSPAMQSLYGAGPITGALEAAFLRGYGDSAIIARYRAFAPLYHLRMAAYCLWQEAQGEGDYSAAARLELKAL
ncbi:MAG: phosphotransferase family protein [Paracoccaceae bacterium]